MDENKQYHIMSDDTPVNSDVVLTPEEEKESREMIKKIISTTPLKHP